MSSEDNATDTTVQFAPTTAIVPATTTLPYDVLDIDPGAWGVAVAITVLVVMSLCLVVLYTKARRRRAAARQQHSSVRALSGGVPMAVGAYQNYGPRLNEYLAQGRNINPQPPAFIENPPSYEDAMRQTNTNYSTGVLNMSYSGSSIDLVQNTSGDQPVPPPYSPSSSIANTQQPLPRSTDLPQQRTNEPASTSSTAPQSSPRKQKNNKEKDDVEVDNSVLPSVDKDTSSESQVSAANVQTTSPPQQSSSTNPPAGRPDSIPSTTE